MTTDVSTHVNHKSALTDAALAEIVDFESAAKVFADAGIVTDVISDFGTGFRVVDKETLVGVPFIVAEWRFNTGDFIDDNGEKRVFVSAACITKNGDKVVINDGGSGIADQFRMITDQRVAKGHQTPQNGLLVPAGLTVSNYQWTDEKGHQQPGRTYYLSESPAPVR